MARITRITTDQIRVDPRNPCHPCSIHCRERRYNRRRGRSVVYLGEGVVVMGQPAARVGDMHTCPMQTPAVPPIPHVGGPIMPPGCPKVLIGGMPAARVGDMA